MIDERAPLAGGVGFEAQAARKQLVWSPDSRRLLFRRGSPPWMNFTVADVATGEIVDILPDTIEGRLRTVGNIFTGPPVWSPASDRIAFLAGRVDEFGAVNMVYVASHNADGSWGIQSLESDSFEKTAVGWARDHVAWASRARGGATSVAVAPVSQDSIGRGISIAGGDARVTGLLAAPDGVRFLATRQGAAPQVIDTQPPRIVRSDLPPSARIEDYVGWLDRHSLLAFRYPSEWRSELAIVRVPDGAVRTILGTDATLMDGTLARTERGVQIVFSLEDGSQPRSYRFVALAPSVSVIDSGSATPPRFESDRDPWSSRIVSWQTEDGNILHSQILSPRAGLASPPPTVVVPYGGYRNTALSHTYFLDVLLRDLLHDGWQTCSDR